MNLERIAEIEAAAEVTLATLGDRSKTSLNAAVALELCRLARLGLRVEGAPTCVIGDFDDAAGLSALARTVYFANGKRVALVVLEDAK